MICTRIFLGILSVALLATPAWAAQAMPDCEDWNTGAFFEAATVEDVTACLDAGADLMARDGIWGTALHRAVIFNDNPAVIEALIAGGADPEVRKDGGGTPLHLVQLMGNPAVIEALIAGGADPEVRNDRGLTPLHLVDRLVVLEALLAAGANPMARDDGGRTPLHSAAGSGRNPEIIATLLAAGANPMARDVEGQTPLHRAAEYNVPIPGRIHTLIEALHAAGANPMARDEYGNTPLHRAAAYGFVFGDDPDDRRHAGLAIEALLDVGADPIVRNAAGETPWDLAQDNEALQGTDGYWRLNDARFEPPGGGLRGTPTTDEAGDFAESVITGQPAGNSGGGGSPNISTPAGNTGITSGGGSCQIPGYPTPTNPQALGLAWCPASVDFQWRVFALQAAGAQCAIATGSSSTPEQINTRHQEINAACGRLDALGVSNCQCPASVRP